MIPWLLKRIGHAALLLVAISIVWFWLLTVSPGDYFDTQRLDPRVSSKTIEKLRIVYGMDKPWWERYADWAKGMLRGEMGVSVAYNQPVDELLWPRCANTLVLTATATLLAWGLAIPLGLWAGMRRGSATERALGLFAAALLAIPELLLATLLVYWAGTSGRWPAGGMHSSEQDSGWFDVLRHLVLPAAVLAAGLFPILFQHLRAAVSETSEMPFVRVMKAMRVAGWRIWWRGILPVAANPMISLFGLSLGGLLSASLLVEVVFGWPGLGPMFVEAVFNKDTYLVLAPVMLASGALTLGNLAADLLLFWNDPRIRVGTK